MLRFLRRLYFTLLCLLPAILFFSYYPIISLGSNSSMNFELSLPLIWLVLFDLVAFISLLSYHFSHKTDFPKTDAPTPLEVRKTASSKKSTSNLSEPRKTTASAKGAPKSLEPLKTATYLGKTLGITSDSISDRCFFLFSLFPLFATISVFWSANPLRGLLTAGIIWLLFFAIFAILFITPLLSPPRRLRPYVLASLFIGTVCVCLFCFLQSILDISGVSRSDTLLCAGCTYRSFGFPHPSGFAIEPQFMGNLLLAPTLTALYLLAFCRPSSLSFSSASRLAPILSFLNAHRTLILSLLAFFFSLTLFFTFSRGAIYAYAVALLILFIFALHRRKTSKTLQTSKTSNSSQATSTPLKNSKSTPHTDPDRAQNPSNSPKIPPLYPTILPIILIPVTSFLCSLCLQGTFAALGPTSETFSTAITKSIHQLSLGLLDFRQNSSRAPQEALDDAYPSDLPPTAPSDDTPQETALNTADSTDSTSQEASEATSNSALPSDQASAQNASSTPQNAPEGKNAPETAPESTIFEGYVPESTNIRLNLNSAALNTWLSAPEHPKSGLKITLNCQESCPTSSYLTPTSILFGVGLGGAGTSISQNSAITGIASPKEIIQNQFFSLLLELGLVGIGLAAFSLLLAFFSSLFSPKFLDGRSAAPSTKSSSAPLRQRFFAKSSSVSLRQRLFASSFWHHPALPLLLSLIVAYLITLNFFSGLPNALHIYLLPPLLYLILHNKPNQPPL